MTFKTSEKFANSNQNCYILIPYST